MHTARPTMHTAGPAVLLANEVSGAKSPGRWNTIGDEARP